MLKYKNINHRCYLASLKSNVMGKNYKEFCQAMGEAVGLGAAAIGAVSGAVVGVGKAAFSALDGKSGAEIEKQWTDAVEAGAKIGWDAGTSFGDTLHEHGGDVAKGVVTTLIVKGLTDKKDSKNKLT